MSNKSGAIADDPVIAFAARALAAGNPLGALNLVALREDAAGLALRGIAMAQLGDLVRAKALLRSAARAFGPDNALGSARCVVAEAEIALATRDLGSPTTTLEAVRATLEQHGDRLNAAHARFIDARRLLLMGRPSKAEQIIAGIDPEPFTPSLRAAYELVVAGIALRRLQVTPARAALAKAQSAARRAGIVSLEAEVQNALRVMDAPAARLVAAGANGRLIGYDDVEKILSSGALVVDACRHVVRNGDSAVPLGGRPLLFELARALGEVWPDDAPRGALIETAFEMMIDDDEDRLRLRVEIGRLRALLRPVAAIIATKRGFALVPHQTHHLVVLAPPVEEDHASILALLSDGEAWSSSALALALAAGQRSIQRALDTLQNSGKVRSYGRGCACRWMAAPLIGVTTALLLPGSLPGE